MIPFLLIPSGLLSAPSCTKEGKDIPFVRIKRIADGLKKPVGLFNAGDGTGRLFIIEQEGIIKIWKDGRILKRPFLDIRDRVVSGGEKGLLGLAFHPDFKKNRRFFVNYTTERNGLVTMISEFMVSDSDPDIALRQSERTILTIPQPYGNHNGGNIVFGPDGYLYIGMGDGGSANDPHGNGQNLKTLLGKMLRIDVNRIEKDKAYAIPPDNPFVQESSALPEIWAYGLRNPWRFSFDPVTGLLYAGDVGQNAREEIDIIKKGGNYGWNIMEGMICTPGVNPRCKREGLELPILDYPRSTGISITGGFVYRGRDIPELCGAYIYGDYGSGRVMALRYDMKDGVTKTKTLLKTRLRISSFGEDEDHELYIVDHRGQIFKIVP